MKLSEYLESVRQENPRFDKLVREIMEWTPLPSKIKIFLDENLPQELKNELKSFSKFKVVKTAQGESDETIFNFCSNKGFLLFSLDKSDFWNDKKFPLHKSPGIVLISSRTQTLEAYIECLAKFLVHFELIGTIRRFPDFAKKMKFKISSQGFVHKFITHNGKIEKVSIEYE